MAVKRIHTLLMFALLAVGVYFGSAFALAAQAQGDSVSITMYVASGSSLFGNGDPFEADNKKKAEVAESRQPVNFPSTNVQLSGF